MYPHLGATKLEADKKNDTHRSMEWQYRTV
jgi:hypothetical protein